MNHELTPHQEKEVKEVMKCRCIITPPKKIKDIWIKITPYGMIDTEALEEITDYLSIKAREGDYVLVQGEFGATFYIVDYCFWNGLVPVYATSERRYNERHTEEGSIERHHIFSHVQFRKYVRWRNP